MRIEGLTPYLHYEDAGAALDWLVRVLGFVEKSRYVDQSGLVREGEMVAGATELWFAGHGPGYWQHKGHGPDQLTLVWVDNVDSHWVRSRSAGLDLEPPVDKPYGVREYTVTDPEGHKWGIMQRLDAPVSLEPGWQEIKPRMP